MKKQLFLLATFLLVSVMTIYAQDTSSNDSNSSESVNRAQSVYFEILGPGVTYSFNYDTRFQNTPDGLGGRIGVSLIVADGSSLFTLPAMVNYLLGNDGKYFEMGLGATYLNVQEDETLFDENPSVIGTMVFGYRSQPVDGGFMFRAGFSPIISEGNFIPYYPYLSLGYTF